MRLNNWPNMIGTHTKFSQFYFKIINENLLALKIQNLECSTAFAITFLGSFSFRTLRRTFESMEATTTCSARLSTSGAMMRGATVAKSSCMLKEILKRLRR